MGSESAEVEEKMSPEGHGSPHEADRESGDEGEVGEEEQVTPEDKKRKSPEKQDEEPEEGAVTTGKRPARERKSVERYSAASPRKASASKAIVIQQGSGTKLKDIPNVAFKLAKRKADDNLQALHSILFGRRNAYFLKRNILQFSGFAWTENKEKHKTKVKEKLDKFTKDKLIGFCEVFDIHFPKTSTKKEDVSAKLLEFLESPHVTRDLLLADKEKKTKKRRSRTKVSSEAAEDVSLDKETKKHKKSVETEVRKGRKQSSKTEENNEPECSAGSTGSGGTQDASSGEEDNNGLEEESDHVKFEETKEHVSQEPLENKGSDERHAYESAEPEAKGRVSPIKKTSSVKSDKSRLKHVSKKATQPVEDESDGAPDVKHSSTKELKNSKVSTKEKAALLRTEDRKKSSMKNVALDECNSSPSKYSKSKKEDRKKGQNKEKALHKEKNVKKKEAKHAPKAAKEQGKGKKKAGPTTEELHSVASNILKEVDFNTATLADILKQLGAHFDMDLMDRKAEVKSIIEEVINSMTDNEDDEDDDDNLGGNEEGNTEQEDSEGDGKK